MSDKQYIAFPVTFTPGYPTPKKAIVAASQQPWWPRGISAKVYEVGIEVAEPDYGPLVEWHRRQSSMKEIRFQHHGFDPSGSGCSVNADGSGCICGLLDALKAAQIE